MGRRFKSSTRVVSRAASVRPFTHRVHPLIFFHRFIHFDGVFSMYRIALILGLLVTPAAAETYSKAECGLFKQMLENCTIRPACDSNHSLRRGISRAVAALGGGASELGHRQISRPV